MLLLKCSKCGYAMHCHERYAKGERWHPMVLLAPMADRKTEIKALPH